ncbi:MAG TPA: class I SAM-dependent methyltransferase [Candidatus Methylomirabilis sp.]|nr:class I SAM-dependent methyltransferase [Candidatus Methylomirabilis sp.]
MSEGQEVQCLLCDGRRFALLFEDEYRVLLCRGCGLVFIGGSARDLDDFYSHQYVYGSADTSHDRIVRWVLRHLPAGGERTLLEIGCGRGRLLVRLRERGFRVFGIEPGQRAAEHARRAYGLTVGCFMLDALAGPMRDQRYDAVLMIQTLEHLADPLGGLLIVRGLMARDGLLFVEVPHYFSPNGLYRWRAGRRYVPSANHLFVYSAHTLAALLRRAGFEIVQRTRTFNDLRIVARPAPGARAPSPSRARAYWEARAFHVLTPLLLRAADAARGMRDAVRGTRVGPRSGSGAGCGGPAGPSGSSR